MTMAASDLSSRGSVRVLQINQSDVGGGAGIAGHNLHKALARFGVESSMLVKDRLTDDPSVAELRGLDRVQKWVRPAFRLIGLNNIHTFSPVRMLWHPFFKGSDILHFHNIHNGYFNYLAFPLLRRLRPCVITLHDMWYFTGHCAYSFDCERWLSGCGSCPYRDSYPRIYLDNTGLEYRLKKWSFNHESFVFVSPSKWLADLARSSLIGDARIVHVPNGIDLSEYHPMNKLEARKELGLPMKGLVIGFASHWLGEGRKGFGQVGNVLTEVKGAIKRDVFLATLGHIDSDFVSSIPILARHFGFDRSPEFKRKFFSALDLLILPTLVDNFPLVIQEALACGTPVVSNRVGGVPELVIEGATGALALAGDAPSLARAVVELVSSESFLEYPETCRRFAVERFSIERQAERMREIYLAELSRWRARGRSDQSFGK